MKCFKKKKKFNKCRIVDKIGGYYDAKYFKWQKLIIIAIQLFYQSYKIGSPRQFGGSRIEPNSISHSPGISISQINHKEISSKIKFYTL